MIYYTKNNVQRNCRSKWENKLQRNIQWQSCFYQLSKIHDVDMKWLEMRIMHRITGTNVTVTEMGVANNSTCNFCLIAKDTMQHIFWECTHRQHIWTRFLVLLNKKCTSCYRLRLSECLINYYLELMMT